MFKALGLLVLIGALLAPTASASSSISGDGERLLDSKGVPVFVTALNYEGPADRAWQMWQNDRFDANLIDADFGRAASAGATALRLFVQAPLAQDIAAGNWNKLDTVVGLAEKRNLQLIVSLHDYGERDLARVSDTAGKIAARYRGRAGILAYDFKNEPRFNDIALSRYASPVPLQRRDLIDTFGERLPRAELADFRATDEGRRDIPPNLTDDEAWLYINDLRLYREMLAEASAWVRERGFRGTTLDYLNDAAGQKWAPLRSALDASLKAWLTPQVDAIRRGDPVASDHGASRRRRAGQPARQSDGRLQHAASLSEHGRGVGASDAGADQDAAGRAQRSAVRAGRVRLPDRHASIPSVPRCTRWRSCSACCRRTPPAARSGC